ncbi:MAG: efflux RND transporter periplasmic adaptor subunit [Salinibacter sp.]
MLRFRFFGLPLLATLLLLTGCSAEQSGPASPTVRTVQTAPIQSRAEASARSFTGTLRAPLETNLSFRVAGTVTDVRVDVGSAVEEGDLLARLDAEDYRLRMESARASYRQDKAAAENARSELRRIKALYANDNASLSAYDRARTQYETATNKAKAAKRQLDLARKRLGYTRLTAPASGTIAAKRVEEGETLGVGQPVVRLAAGKRLEVQVPENFITQIEVGQSASDTVTALRGTPVPATVTEVASAPAGRRPTYPVVVTLNNSVPALRSGMTARVQFDLGSDGGLVVPAEAVGEDPDGRFVYVVDRHAGPDSLAADGRVARRAVTTGDLTPSGLVVTSGLQPGDQVVTAGLSMLRDGDPVRISRLLSDRDGS